MLIGFMPIIFVIQLYLSKWTIQNDKFMFWGLIANIFGILEHINYYNKQLMIDNSSDLTYIIKNKKLKDASLAKNIADNEI